MLLRQGHLRTMGRGRTPDVHQFVAATLQWPELPRNLTAQNSIAHTGNVRCGDTETCV